MSSDLISDSTALFIQPALIYLLICNIFGSRSILSQFGQFVFPPSPPYKFCPGALPRFGSFRFAFHFGAQYLTSRVVSLFSIFIYTLKARGRGPCPCLSQMKTEHVGSLVRPDMPVGSLKAGRGYPSGAFRPDVDDARNGKLVEAA